MVQHVIKFNTGETTCAAEPGQFCRFLGSTHFGTRSVCMLFGNAPLFDADGWIQRCEQCMREFPTTAEPETR